MGDDQTTTEHAQIQKSGRADGVLWVLDPPIVLLPTTETDDGSAAFPVDPSITHLANGLSTSGHGKCGHPRLLLRSGGRY
jgi:hypothetical protein